MVSKMQSYSIFHLDMSIRLVNKQAPIEAAERMLVQCKGGQALICKEPERHRFVEGAHQVGSVAVLNLFCLRGCYNELSFCCDSEQH